LSFQILPMKNTSPLRTEVYLCAIHSMALKKSGKLFHPDRPADILIHGVWAKAIKEIIGYGTRTRQHQRASYFIIPTTRYAAPFLPGQPADISHCPGHMPSRCRRPWRVRRLVLHCASTEGKHRPHTFDDICGYQPVILHEPLLHGFGILYSPIV